MPIKMEKHLCVLCGFLDIAQFLKVFQHFLIEMNFSSLPAYFFLIEQLVHNINYFYFLSLFVFQLPGRPLIHSHVYQSDTILYSICQIHSKKKQFPCSPIVLIVSGVQYSCPGGNKSETAEWKPNTLNCHVEQ